MCLQHLSVDDGKKELTVSGTFSGDQTQTLGAALESSFNEGTPQSTRAMGRLQRDERSFLLSGKVCTAHPTGFGPSLCGGLETDAEAGFRGQRNEPFETELFPFAAYQIGHAGLTDPQELGRLRLRQLLGLDELPQIRHESRLHKAL